MLVSTRNKSQTDPGSSLDDYAAWRSLAIAIRRSVLAEDPPGAYQWLTEWTSSKSPLHTGVAAVKANPTKEEAPPKYPALPKDLGIVMAMGGARVFTDKIPSLVSYLVDGDALVREPSNAEHASARTRTIRPTRFEEKGGDPLWWIKPAVGGGLLVALAGAVFWVVRKFRGREGE